METVQITGAIIAITQVIKSVVPNEKVNGPVVIIVAAVLGLLAGVGAVNGLTPLSGLITGLAASGAVSLGQFISGNK